MQSCIMSLPQASLHSAALTRVTPEKLNQTKFIQHFANSEFKHHIGLAHTAVKTDVVHVHLEHSNAWNQASSNLINALTSQPIIPVTQISRTSNPTVESGVNTTHITMTSNIISALMEDQLEEDHAARNRVMVLILIGIFMFISLLITMFVVVMCKKKNSVFMLQKCEQESDLELDEIEDINTELDTSESEYEKLDSNCDRKRSESYPCLGKLKYMDECFEESENLQKSVNPGLLKKKSVDSVSPCSTPLLFNRNTGTGSSELFQEKVSDGNNSEHSLNKPTGSLSSDKYVICLDKFSIHSQQTDSNLKHSKPSHRKQKLIKSKTFDASLKSKQEFPAKGEKTKTTKIAKGKQLQSDVKVYSKKDTFYQLKGREFSNEVEDGSISLDQT